MRLFESGHPVRRVLCDQSPAGAGSDKSGRTPARRQLPGHELSSQAVSTASNPAEAAANRPLETYQIVGRLLGPAVFVLMLATSEIQDVMAPIAWRTAAVALWMAIWWATEAIPVAVTAFLPIVVLEPLGIATLREAAARAGRDARILRISGAGPDHPVALECPETRYLKAVWMEIR